VCHLVPPTEQHLNNPLRKKKKSSSSSYSVGRYDFLEADVLTHDGDQSCWDDSRIFMTFTWAAMDLAACFYTTGQPKTKREET
jgi:hypothetical protein